MRLSDFKKAIIIWGIVSSEAIDKIKSQGVPILIPENRPYLLGMLHNAPLLRQNRIEFIYCTDNMIGFLFAKKKIEKTIIFYKDLNEDGIVGISGSLYVTLLSKIHNIPIEVYPQGIFKNNFIDNDVSTLGGRKFVIKEDKNAIEFPCDEKLEWSILK